MAVMADEFVDVMVSHDAVYRRWPEQNARQQHDKLSSGHDAEREVGRTDSGGRHFVRSSLRVGANSMSHCQGLIVSARRRSVELPIGGQQNCPLVANGSALQVSWPVASPPCLGLLG